MAFVPKRVNTEVKTELSVGFRTQKKEQQKGHLREYANRLLIGAGEMFLHTYSQEKLILYTFTVAVRLSTTHLKK